MALDEREEVNQHLEEIDEQQSTNLDDRRMQV
jgi:Ras GTPase-activating-like protein IQGAP2/3